MKNYKAILLTDKGKRSLRISADNEETARYLILQAESCPESAIQSIKEITKAPFVLVATWNDGTKQAYTTLGAFIRFHPKYSRDSIHNWIQRRKKPYMHEDLILEKIPLNK